MAPIPMDFYIGYSLERVVYVSLALLHAVTWKGKSKLKRRDGTFFCLY